jgi:TatD DNase family protein
MCLRSLIDTHCHLNFSDFDDDREVILQQCRQNKINKIIIPAVCKNDWPSILTLCHDQTVKPTLFPALGLHPYFIDQHAVTDLDYLVEYCKTQSLVAIGEIGLDFFLKNTDREKQQYYFEIQLHIAVEYQLPVLLHVRKAHNEVLTSLTAHPNLRGIVHAYSGSYEQAKEYLKRGFKLGFGGAFSYPQATRLRSLIGRLPIEAWVLETDAPDMAPINHQGERNSPHYLVEIALQFIQLCDQTDDSKNKILSRLYQNTLEIVPLIKTN